FLFADIPQVAAAHCMIHPIPARNFTFPFVLLNETIWSPFSAGLRRDHHGTSEIRPLINEGSFLCCLWSDNNFNCSLYRANMKSRKFIPSEINIPASQEIDSSWKMECWLQGKLDLLVCNLWVLYLREDLKVNLFYAGSELSLADVSTRSLRGPAGAPCGRSGDAWQCLVPSLRLDLTYVLWLQVLLGGTALRSPPLALTPLRVVKPEPPSNLHLEMAEGGQVRMCWSHPVLLPFPLQCQLKISANPGNSGWQMVQPALENSVAIDNTLLDSSCLVQVRCRNSHGPGFWSDWSTPYDLSVGAQVLYFPARALRSAGSSVSLQCMYRRHSRAVEPREVVWWLDLAEEIPASHYSLGTQRVSKVTLSNLRATKPRGTSFPFSSLYCCHQSRECHPRYAELYVVDMNVNITCETDGYLAKMTCRWAANPSMLLPGSSLQLRYSRSQIYCPDFPSPSPNSEVKECHLQRNHSYECTFQPIFLLSGYTLWIEFKHFLGMLESNPTCVIPAEVVKPLPPSSVGAELTRNVGLLNVSWTNPIFTKTALEFQVRYAVNGEEIPWQLYEVSGAPGSSAGIEVEQLCVEYVVQVRCRELDGSGYWSDWSSSAQTRVQDIRAPLQGPEFWRILREDPAKRQRNVTLVWKPLRKNHSLCSVSRYIIRHQTPGNTSWEEYVDHGTSWSFPWTEHTHTITILAMNSLGVSSVNLNLTLSQQMSTVDAVRSLSAYPVNSTCVILGWALSPQIRGITSFVIEWRNLNREEELKWVRVPPNSRKYYIYDYFILIEKYQFSLYPVFAGGVGKARATDQFSKGGFEDENSGSLSVLVPVVISTSVLLLGVLLVSHQRMKKLLWEDVPNPKNCSWAQGVNFQQPETFEHLFTRHPEVMPFEPLDTGIVLEDISVTRASKKEGTQDFLGIDSAFPNPQDSEHDSACSSSHFNSSSSSESSRGRELRYATIVSHSQSTGICQRTISPRSCFDRCCLAEDPPVPGAFSSRAWEVGGGLLGVPAPPDRQPSKSLSLISSEGFSEPSDQEDAFPDSPERSLCYLGITLLEKRGSDIFLTESSGLMCQFHTRDQLRDMGLLQEFIQSSLRPKATVPYVPQFQMGKEATGKNS
ncbi:LEPR protein, partial [Sapayoa aenigma]|nr:LEPR protein [Sapayoa aenigma]